MTKHQALDIKLGVGTYAWCRCGLSKNKPWCDGAHKGQSEVAPLVFYQPEEKRVSICSCGKTENGPFCDDTQDCALP